MNISRANLILMIVNLVALGLLLGIGIMLHSHDMGPPGGRFGQRFGPDFHSELDKKILTVEPNWRQEIVAARDALKASIAAPVFDEAAFSKASANFDRLMDEFHTVMQEQIHAHIKASTPDERQKIAHTMGDMPLPLMGDDKGAMPPPP